MLSPISEHTILQPLSLKEMAMKATGSSVSHMSEGSPIFMHISKRTSNLTFYSLFEVPEIIHEAQFR